MSKQVIRVPGLSEAIERTGLPVSPAVKAGGFIFTSAMLPIDRKTSQLVSCDIAKQTELCLDNLKATLEAAGSSLEKAVKVTVYASNSAYYNTINKVYAKYFPSNPPARTFITVASWPVELDIAIDCTALA